MIRKNIVLSALAVIILIIIAVALGSWAYKSARIAQNQRASAGEQSAPQLASSTLPLWSGVQWSAPQSKTMNLASNTLQGVEVQSAPITGITDLASSYEPFLDYYDTKLTALGWSEDQQLAAGGPGSGMAVYQKGSGVIVLSYSSQFLNAPKNAPEQCPCNLSLFVFSAHNPSSLETDRSR